jgi:hypothetical protein
MEAGVTGAGDVAYPATAFFIERHYPDRLRDFAIRNR